MEKKLGVLKFKKIKKSKGLLYYIDLLDWFNSQDSVEQKKIIEYSGRSTTDLFKTVYDYTNENKDSFFANIVRNAINSRDLEFALKYLNQIKPENWSVDSQHFFYQSLLPLFYKLRDEHGDALKLTVYYAKKNVLLIKNHKEELLDYFESQPHFGRTFPAIGCFSYLIKIYEKQGKITDAIALCQEALDLGIMFDANKVSYKNRLEKLKK